MNHRVDCKYCGRYLFNACGTTIIEQLPCPNTKCKAKLNIKIVTSDSTPAQLNYKFTTQESPGKTTS